MQTNLNELQSKNNKIKIINFSCIQNIICRDTASNFRDLDSIGFHIKNEPLGIMSSRFDSPFGRLNLQSEFISNRSSNEVQHGPIDLSVKSSRTTESTYYFARNSARLKTGSESIRSVTVQYCKKKHLLASLDRTASPPPSKKTTDNFEDDIKSYSTCKSIHRIKPVLIKYSSETTLDRLKLFQRRRRPSMATWSGLLQQQQQHLKRWQSEGDLQCEQQRTKWLDQPPSPPSRPRMYSSMFYALGEYDRLVSRNQSTGMGSLWSGTMSHYHHSKRYANLQTIERKKDSFFVSRHVREKYEDEDEDEDEEVKEKEDEIKVHKTDYCRMTSSLEVSDCNDDEDDEQAAEDDSEDSEEKNRENHPNPSYLAKFASRQSVRMSRAGESSSCTEDRSALDLRLKTSINTNNQPYVETRPPLLLSSHFEHQNQMTQHHLQLYQQYYKELLENHDLSSKNVSRLNKSYYENVGNSTNLIGKTNNATKRFGRFEFDPEERGREVEREIRRGGEEEEEEEESHEKDSISSISNEFSPRRLATNPASLYLHPYYHHFPRDMHTNQLNDVLLPHRLPPHSQAISANSLHYFDKHSSLIQRPSMFGFPQLKDNGSSLDPFSKTFGMNSSTGHLGYGHFDMSLISTRPPLLSGGYPNGSENSSDLDIVASGFASNEPNVSTHFNGVSGERKRISRPLTGRHVRHGTGASPATLALLRHVLQERRRVRELSENQTVEKKKYRKKRK